MKIRFRATQIEKYQIIDKLKSEYPVSKICRVLSVVRRSYFKWCSIGKPIANNYKEHIAKIISEEHNNLRSIYGTIRLKYHIKNKLKINLNHKLIRRYKHILGLETNQDIILSDIIASFKFNLKLKLIV